MVWSMIYEAQALSKGIENVKIQSQKRPKKKLQLERKIAMKWRFLHIRVVVFRFSRCQSIAFTVPKHNYYAVKAQLLHAKRAAFRWLFSMFWAVFEARGMGCFVQVVGYQLFVGF